MKNDNQDNLAVLIDADNIQPSIIDGLLAEIAKYGVASVKRIYGDWTDPRLKGWKSVLNNYALIPIQQFSYTTGKNATDSAMIIDAMDLLYTKNFTGFCLVSSDSDFTRLASRIREEGLKVYGFGEKKTPEAFTAACDKFIYVEILRSESEELKQEQKTEYELRSDTKLVQLLRDAIESSADESGWAPLSDVGNYIAKKSPKFDPRNYGYTKLSDLFRAVGLFEINERGKKNSPLKIIYVKDKRK
jgi:uncharacterized LabA/DUF88 family protein